jgi:CheY-like chemotaxis protein
VAFIAFDHLGHEAEMGKSMQSYILVIDDDATVRQTLTAVLEHEGYEVQCAPGGRQGLQAFRDRRPDLVISDMM